VVRCRRGRGDRRRGRRVARGDHRGQGDSPAVPAKVRELVWDKVRKELPPASRRCTSARDAALCAVPWPALPGDKPGTILLEDYAVATIPHGPVPARQVVAPGPDQEPARRGPRRRRRGLRRRPGRPVPQGHRPRGPTRSSSPGTKLGWDVLPASETEGRGVAAAAGRKNLACRPPVPGTRPRPRPSSRPSRRRGTPTSPHTGFFADPSFRSVFRLDERDYEMARWGERVGRAVNSPMVMTGLVFAGANNPGAPGRGVVTVEALIDLDLSGLQLAGPERVRDGVRGRGRRGGHVRAAAGVPPGRHPRRRRQSVEGARSGDRPRSWPSSTATCGPRT